MDGPHGGHQETPGREVQRCAEGGGRRRTGRNNKVTTPMKQLQQQHLFTWGLRLGGQRRAGSSGSSPPHPHPSLLLHVCTCLGHPFHLRREVSGACFALNVLLCEMGGLDPTELGEYITSKPRSLAPSQTVADSKGVSHSGVYRGHPPSTSCP